MTRHRSRSAFPFAASALVAAATTSCASNTGRTAGFAPASVLPDLSGMVALEDGRFLAVHDAKAEDEPHRPRVSLLRVPTDLDGVLWMELDVDWGGRPSNDLESAASIPGTDDVLLVESGDNGSPGPRIFRARLDGTRLAIAAVAPWPHEIYNVESSAVARFGDRFVFLYAERAEKQPSTEIRWAEFTPDTLAFGAFRSVTLAGPDPARTNRPMVALDVAPDGSLYIAAAFDSEAAGLPDPDDGPFASSVWMVGAVAMDGDAPTVTLLAEPRRLGTLDGVKVESVSVVTTTSGERQVYVGLDDENYGATLRRLPPTD